MYDRPYNNSLWTSHFQSTVFQSIVTKHENQKKSVLPQSDPQFERMVPF